MTEKTSDEKRAEKIAEIMARTGGKSLNKVLVMPQGDVRMVAFVLDDEGEVVRLTWNADGDMIGETSNAVRMMTPIGSLDLLRKMHEEARVISRRLADLRARRSGISKNRAGKKGGKNA